MNLTVKHLVLQGDMDAAGRTILNLNLAGLNLSKNSVGLGNVDNTSDANKPISTLTQNALNAKEDFITPNDVVTDYFGGDKAFHHLGTLALQAGDTTLQSLSAIGLNASGSSEISARRNDHTSGPSYAKSAVTHYGASFAGSLLGLSAAGSGALAFINSNYGFIYSNGLSPLVFGYNGIRRMRLMTGLNVGADTDPGAGCISATGTITGLHLIGTDLVLSAGATLNDDLVLVGAGSNLTVGGNATVGGTLEATLGLLTPSNIAGGGNLAVVGSIISFSGLPTSNPGVAGRLWRSGNDVKISTG